jgi:molecular chaperone GrpE
MWNNLAPCTDAKNCVGQVSAHGPPKDDGAMNTTPSHESAGPHTVETAVSTAAQTELSVAYAALLADHQAFRARLEREKTRVVEAEKALLAQALLDSSDHLELALGVAAQLSVAQNQMVRDLTQGVRLALAILHKRIAEMGAERMTTLGQRFDPRFAEAVSTIRVTDPAQDGIIMQEIRPGYHVGDRLLRPARVRVGRVG